MERRQHGACQRFTSTPGVQKELQGRLSRIEGHVRGVKRMLAEHGTCEDFLLQLAAIRPAVNQVQARLLENHLETCVADAVRAGNGGKALDPLKGRSRARAEDRVRFGPYGGLGMKVHDKDYEY